MGPTAEPSDVGPSAPLQIKSESQATDVFCSKIINIDISALDTSN